LIEVEAAGDALGTLRPFNQPEIPMKSAALLMAAALLALPVAAQTANPHAGHGTHAHGATKGGKVLYEGQVKRLNPDAKRVTLAHGPLQEFDMPAMTMAFGVKDVKQLAALKEGDKVRFAVEAEGDNYVITRIEPAK